MGAEVLGLLPIHRFDVDTYAEMVASGALEGLSVELVDGLILDMSPHGPEHSVVIARLSRHFAGARAWLRVQLPLEVEPDSIPEPDLALVEQEPSPKAHPRSALLVVEVSVSSHVLDRGLKAALYARAGVNAYWTVDVPARTIEVRNEPRPDGYIRGATYALGAIVPSPAEGIADLDVAALLAGIDD